MPMIMAGEGNAGCNPVRIDPRSVTRGYRDYFGHGIVTVLFMQGCCFLAE